MSKKDKLIKEIDILREKRKDWFNVLFALSSAVIVLVYAVISGEKPIYVLILGIIGFVGVVSIGVYYKKIETDLAKRLNELGKED
jgi:archaellum biogenesis protein FlaJ (TadC family)